MRLAPFALLPLLAAAPAGAQGRSTSPSDEPASWIGLSAGLLQAQSVTDGRTGTRWDFAGNVVQYRAHVERALANGVSVGLLGGIAQLPTTYTVYDPTAPGAVATCASGCPATTDLVTVAITGRLAGGRGRHQVLEGAVGVAQFRDFRGGDDGALPPAHASDLWASAAYGLGYTFSARTEVVLAQELGIVSHARAGLPRNESSIRQQSVTRFTFRYGLGFRQPTARGR